MIYHILQFSWGLPQNLIGLLMYLCLFNRKSFRYEKSYVRVWKRQTSLSMGQYLFVTEKYNRNLLSHEYGHTYQSLYLGPFYLLFVGIPSAVWCFLFGFDKFRKKVKIGYYDMPFEKNASRLGRKHAKKFG